MNKLNGTCRHFLARCEALVLRRPKTLMLMIGVLCAVSLQYTNDNLGINTDTTKILDQDLPFLQDRARLLETFPQDDEAILVVVDSDIPERTTQAVEYLGTQFRSEQQQITSVYIPDEGDFFAGHGLLYLSREELEELTGKLVQAQPFNGLGAVIRAAQSGDFQQRTKARCLNWRTSTKTPC